MNPTLTACDDLVATRRRQLAALVEQLQAALDLQEVVETEAARRQFATVEQFLRGADSNIERARWEALLNRATAPVPNGDET